MGSWCSCTVDSFWLCVQHFPGVRLWLAEPFNAKWFCLPSAQWSLVEFQPTFTLRFRFNGIFYLSFEGRKAACRQGCHVMWSTLHNFASEWKKFYWLSCTSQIFHTSFLPWAIGIQQWISMQLCAARCSHCMRHVAPSILDCQPASQQKITV